MEEKILSVLLDMQIDVKEMKKEQRRMREEQQGMKIEQQSMKKDMRDIKREEKSIKENLKMTNQKLDNLQEEVRINKINISKILEVQNKTIDFLKSTIDKNDYEHKEFEFRISDIERKVV